MSVIIVPGRPVSINADVPRRRAWAAAVADAARAAFPQPLVDDDLLVTVTFWYDRRPDFDTDNISKPICDALQGIVYGDDDQIAERRARRKDINGAYHLRGVDPGILVAISNGAEFVSIEVGRLGDGVARI
jgi:hypothetical protein